MGGLFEEENTLSTGPACLCKKRCLRVMTYKEMKVSFHS